MKKIYLVFVLAVMVGCKIKQEQNKSAIINNIKIEIREDSTANYSFKAEIPKYSFSAANLLNDSVEKFVDSLKSDFIKDCEVVADELSSYLNISIEESYCDSNIVSYCFVIDTYNSGAVHNVQGYRTFNYNLKTQSFIYLSGVVNIPDSTLLSTLETRLVAETDTCVTPGTFTDYEIKNLTFNLSADSISFDFNQYSIGSYVCGSPKVKFARRDLFVK